MSDALEEHDGKVSIGGRNITNLRFADDIYALAEGEQELEALVQSLDKTCTRYLHVTGYLVLKIWVSEDGDIRCVVVNDLHIH